ncbi:MAG: PLP-dependent aminotransferase family protein [Actinobacteria bacterium]|nr:PLP-dependent aminotransferase family protein [Actinomycetota bacterium]
MSETGAAFLPYAARVGGLNGSEIDSSTSLLQRQNHDIVRLAMGSPAAEAIPSEVLGTIAAEIVGAGAPTFDYGPTEGEAGLLTQLERFTGTARERLLVTAGGMQGLDLVCKLFVDRGDVVAVEAPTYTNGSATISSYEGRLLEVPVDEDGMVVEALAELGAALPRPPKMIYAIPTFQNPSGKTLSLRRREELLALAESWGAMVLEDDPYGRLAFDGAPPPSLVSLSDEAPWVIGVQTFSKIVAPGLRVGWVEAAPAVIARMIDAKQCMDTCTNVPAQLLMERFLALGEMDAHLVRLRSIYRERKDAMMATLDAAFGADGATWTDPGGGFFTWVTFASPVDTRDLFEAALAAGVAYIPGDAFAAGPGFEDSLRLCFASNTSARAADGVARLRAAIVAKYGSG